jgi:hypothetical protein
MRRGTLRNSAWTVAAFGIAVAVSACGSSESSNPNSLGGGTTPGQNDPNNPNAQTPPTPEEQVQQILDARKTDYGEAARTAKLKLNDSLPTFDEINQIANAPDDAAKKVAYEALVDKWMDAPAFASTMVKFWKDTFRTGGNGQPPQNGNPDLDKAAFFAAQVTTASRPYTDILTAGSNTCPTFDATTGAFTDGDCGTTPTVGVLTDPGLQSQYFSNMAFRRVRFVQETFACSKFPAEFSATPQPMGNGTYTSPWDFNRVVGKVNTPTARIDFQDTSAVICANCHTTINGMAPLFINYDAKGALQATPQVEVPIPGNPKAKDTDYLTSGQSLAWRFGKTITDLPSLGQAMAADPDVAKCAVNRVWNYAMSRGDIVNDLATVPDSVTAPYVQTFTAGGLKLKETLRAVFKSEDFTKF